MPRRPLLPVARAPSLGLGFLHGYMDRGAKGTGWDKGWGRGGTRAGIRALWVGFGSEGWGRCDKRACRRVAKRAAKRVLW